MEETTISPNGESVLRDEIQGLVAGLPGEKNWDGTPLYFYEGVWYPAFVIGGAISFQQHFIARDDDIILASMPKSGTTWLKALTFSVVNRNIYSPTESPLLSTTPHDLVRNFEMVLYSKNQIPDLEQLPSPRIFSSHSHYENLPPSIRGSGCKIVYICRNPLDQLVSDFHFIRKLKRENVKPLSSIDEGFDNVCRGIQSYGPFWDSVLGYWKASLERPDKVLFFKYEDLKDDITFNLKKLAEFLGRSPSLYVDLLKRRGIDVNSSHKWIQILDCYSDPLGWKYQLMGSGNCMDVSHETPSNLSRVCKDVKDLDKLYSMILELGKGLVGQGKDRFSVAIDSINEMLRHASTPTVAGLLSNLRSHEQISSIFWLLHSDLHEVKVTSALEYLSSVVASVEPLHQTASGKRGDLENLSLLEQNIGKGKLQVRFKRRNGRVRVVNEGFHIDQSSSNFTSVLSEDGLVNQINQSLLPKVQFDLELSEKERIDRAKVVLPFEHQGNGEPIHIYDGRRSLTESKTEATLSSSGNSQKTDSGEGEIIYFRDSDDEMPDSDEDPDDDLDI